MLALLSLLQARPDWPGPELAQRLGVSDRTIRNDITRLRDLGYPVDAVRGAAGHYRLGVGREAAAAAARRRGGGRRRRRTAGGPRGRGHRRGQRPGAGQAGAGAAAPAAAPGRRAARSDLAGPGEHRHATSRIPQVDADVLADARRGRPRPRAGAPRPPARRRPADRRRAVPPGQLAAAVVPRRAGSARPVARAAGRPGDPADADAPALPARPDAGGGLHGVRAARGRRDGLGGARADHGAGARGGGAGPDQPDGRGRRVRGRARRRCW